MITRVASFLKVRPGEGWKVAFVGALFALVQAGQGIGANAADSLFFIRFGVDYLPYMFMALGALTFLVALIYSAGLLRVSMRAYLSGLFLLFAGFLVAERLALLSDGDSLYPALWLSVNIVGAVLGTIIWYVAGEVCDTRQAKRLFALFASAGILGGVLGNLITGLLARGLGTENLILLYAGLILASLVLVRRVLARFYHRPAQRRGAGSVWADLSAGFDYVRGAWLLQLTALSSVLFSILYFSISFPFSQAASRTFPNEAELAGFLGLFTSAATAITFLVSLLLANRFYARFGIVNAILVLPLIYLGGFLLWSSNFVLGTAIIARFAQLVILGGLASTAWSALFNVVPPERRGQVLGFDAGVPSQIGVVLSGVLLLLGQRVLDSRQIMLMGMAVALVCALVVWRMKSAYGEALIHALRAGRYEVFAPSPRAFAGFHGNAQALQVAIKALQEPKPSTRRLAAEIMARMGDEAAIPALLRALDDSDAEVRAAALQALGRLDARAQAGEVTRLLGDADSTIRAQAVRVLAELAPAASPDLVARLEQLLNDPECVVEAEAAVALASLGQTARASARLGDMLCERSPAARVLALNALSRIVAAAPESQSLMLEVEAVLEAAKDTSPAVRRAACETLGRLPGERVEAALIRRLDDPDERVRAAAAASLRLRGVEIADRVMQVLAAGDDRAQEAALQALPPHEAKLLEPLRDYARRQVEQAMQARQAAAALPTGGRATRLLREALEDHAERNELRLVTTIGLFGDPEAMKVVARSLRARSGGNRPEAVEALETLGDPRVAKEVIPLFEQDPSTGDGQNKIAAKETLAELLRHGDDWTRALSALAAAELQARELTPQLNALAQRGHGPLSREAARRALDHFQEAGPMETLQTVSALERMLLLRDVPLFEELSPDDLKQVADLAREQLYPPGAIICHEGEEGSELYVIASGEVEVLKQSNGTEKLLATRGVGEFIGEMAIIESTTRFATVRAVGDVRLLVIDAQAFRSILRDRPEVSLAVLRGLSRRLRERV